MAAYVWSRPDGTAGRTSVSCGAHTQPITPRRISPPPHDHRAWFRLWLPLGKTTPFPRHLPAPNPPTEPETAMKAALWLLDGTSVPGLRELILAQEPCHTKSNEITAIPHLLDPIHPEGTVVTIDTADCQRSIVQVLREADADYLPVVKCNGGRRERHRCTVLGGPGLCRSVADPKAWPDLRSLIRAQADPIGPRGRRQHSVHHCISSQPPDAKALPGLVRGHWGVENGLHCTLDVQFREDDCRIRKGNAPVGMGALRRAALNMVRTSTEA